MFCPGGHGGVHAEYMAVAADQRATTVAGQDAGIGKQVIPIRLGDDAGGQRIADAERAADGEYLGALARILRSPGEGQVGRGVVVQFEQREIVVLADLDQASLQFFAVFQGMMVKRLLKNCSGCC